VRHPLAERSEVAAALAVLDAWVGATVAQREQPSLSIGIVYDQDLIWANGYGYADLAKRVPATPATLYRIASISKLFTATAVMQLRDAGKLRLDDRVAARLPWFAIRDTFADDQEMTIRHLLTHTSGLPREVDGVNWSEYRFPAQESMVRSLPGQLMVYPVGTEWKYSNLALSLAGEIVAHASGEPWPQYIERHILRPLGMGSTMAAPRPLQPGLAVGYGRRVAGQARDVEPVVDVGAEAPAGNIASSVQDLAKFVSLQFRASSAGDPQVLKGSTLREMHQVQWLRPDWTGGWGLGFAVRRVDGQTRVGHSGSLPGHRSQIQFAPATKLGVIVLTNANDGDPMRYVDQAFRLVGPALAKVVDSTKAPRRPDPSWARYVGTYTWKHADVNVLVLNGELTMIVPDAENPWETRFLLRPVARHTFRIVPTGFTTGPVGELLTFDLDSAGSVRRVNTPNWYWVPKQAKGAQATR
jgi:CubicO group peptidase (beta-lactamase class C family)